MDSSFSEGAAGPCAWVRASSSVVPLGSPVTATCEVSEGCHLFSQPDLHLDWRLENRLIPDGVVATESGRLSRIVIPNFNYTRAFLVCLARGSPSQVVGGLQIRAGCMWDTFLTPDSCFFSVGMSTGDQRLTSLARLTLFSSANLNLPVKPPRFVFFFFARKTF